MRTKIQTTLVCLLGIFVAYAHAQEYRSIDGTGNNLNHPTWGAAGSTLLRYSPAIYANGVDQIFIPANAREISNLISFQPDPSPSHYQLSNMVWQWGQFIDHDMSLTETNAQNGSTNILVTDPLDPLKPMIGMNRSNYVPGTGDNGIPREHPNQITSFLDASMVYGSDAAKASYLRTFSNGKLNTSLDEILMPNDAGFFVAGDVRVNEQLGLISMHTLFVREHNRLAELIDANATGLPTDPTDRDEEIYQQARKLVGATIQGITYNEFLPALLGESMLSMDSADYNPNINPTINTEFSSAIYRFGHSMIVPHLKLMDDQGNVTETVSLREAFFKPSMMTDEPERIEQVLKGLAMTSAQEVDLQLVEDIRSFLMLDGNPLRFDLAALNIQRGRDHGLADYNSVRESYWLPPAESFADITSDPQLQKDLEWLYGGDINLVDTWVGALAEDHLPGSAVGELTATAIVEQFTRLRDGDRFFYLFDEQIPQLEATVGIDVSQYGLRDVILNNTALSHLPENVFVVPEPSGSTLALWTGVAILASLRRRRSG
ncbi:MAG: peroxidase family protein [Pirellulaceae bacterium]